MILRLAAFLPQLALLSAGVTSAYFVVSSMPAFDSDARVEGLFGDWRVPVVEAVYNRSDYLFQVGFGLLQGDLVASSATEERDELASVDTAIARARRAREALAESAALAPGNAYTWAYLAWADAMQADDAAALSDLNVSWALAPASAQLAPVRLNLYELLLDLGTLPDDRGEVEEKVKRDLAVMRRFEPRHLDVILKDSDGLRSLAAEITTD
ncbi:hypothetical protein EF888_06210 [Silicimonas algicola]|uniref:Uncharacterized protein n=1 Tax=Silicimonas algicola TaxID=1826607 RepID=A0A316FZI3_9RHOB|nr:hypothetical protein [Silicimonas algicola]AZQ66769.1 hypothetical protein EF888_06210 [Silicimonas algicola]PWK53116.1 hypothetical protein C8D95_11418 [Silicimonas algicola]